MRTAVRRCAGDGVEWGGETDRRTWRRGGDGSVRMCAYGQLKRRGVLNLPSRESSAGARGNV